MPYALKEKRLRLRDLPHPVPDPFLVTYFDDLRQVLEKRLKMIKRLSRRLTASEEKELRFMLEELIRVKNSL